MENDSSGIGILSVTAYRSFVDGADTFTVVSRTGVSKSASSVWKT